MSQLILLFTMPVITALIGWLTNKVAIVMLFRPRRGIRILGVQWQGMIPRRQKDIAQRTAELIEREVLDKQLIRQEIQHIDLRPFIDEFAHRLVHENLSRRLRKFPLFRGVLADSTLSAIHKGVIDVLDRESPPMLRKLAAEAEHRLDVRRIVEERISAFDLDKLETVVNQVAGKEFRSIEIMGAVLGFVVGLLQLLILILSGSLEGVTLPW